MAGVGLLLFNHVIAIDFIYCFLREFLQMNLFIEDACRPEGGDSQLGLVGSVCSIFLTFCCLTPQNFFLGRHSPCSLQTTPLSC